MTTSTIDDKISHLKFGKWHLIFFSQIFWMVLAMSMINAAVVFMQETPPFICNNALFTSNTNWSFTQIQNFSFSTPKNSKGKFDGCYMYEKNYSLYAGMDYASAVQHSGNPSDNKIKCQTSYNFNPTDGMFDTVVTQWNLVCDKKINISTMAFVYMAGFFVGCLLAGPLADRFGRKPITMITQICTLVLGIVDPLMPSFPVFMAGRFFIGVFNGGGSGVIYVLCMEILNEGQRTLVGATYWVMYSVGYGLCVPLAAWALRDWRYMHIVCAIPFTVSLVFFWTLPESPRWLGSKGRHDEANAILNRALKWNGINTVALNDKHSKHVQDSDSTIDSHAKSQDNEKISDLIHHPKLILQTLNVFFNWCANSMVYYGIALLITSFAGNVFVNNAISGLIEIPGYLLCIPLLYIARKKSLLLCLILTGICMLLYLAVPEQGYGWAKLLVAFTGKLLVTASFNLIYVVTVEIYPTSIRAGTLTLGSMSARIGSMVAPYINAAADQDDVKIPMIVFGIVSLVAGVLTWWIPESHRKKLPENIKDASEMTYR